MSGLKSYLAAAARQPLLDAESERRLGRAVQRGRAAAARLRDGSPEANDEETIAQGIRAHHTLVESNLRLVVSIAKTYPTHTLVDLSDLIQAGNQGLVRAAERFDPDRGFRFTTFAVISIRSAIARCIDQSTPALKLPIDMVNEMRSVLRACSARNADVPAEWVDVVRAYSAASLDAPISAEDVTPLGLLQPSGEAPVDAAAIEATERSLLRSRLAELPALHRQVLQLRFGLVDDRPLSAAATARALKVSPRRLARLVDEAIGHLRRRLPTAEAS